MTTTKTDRQLDWRIVWREGFAPVLPTDGLEALAAALRTDDPRLTQGSTTTPPPLICVADWPVEAADAIAFVGVSVSGGFVCTAEEAKANPNGPPHSNPGAALVGAVEEFFARACFDCDDAVGEVAACRFFLRWWDATPRAAVFRELLPEVELVLAIRRGADAPLTPAPDAPTTAEETLR